MNRRQHPRMKLILNAPDKVSAKTKLGSNIVTIICWVIFIYLWIPIITLVAWYVGFTHAYDEFAFARQAGEMRDILLFFGLIVAALGGALLLWALKEYLRFRNVNRRRRPDDASAEQLAVYTGVQETDVLAWQGMRRMMALHDEHGMVIGVRDEHAVRKSS